jgi:hypothetical protein
MLPALIAGLGIAAMPAFIARSALADGRPQADQPVRQPTDPITECPAPPVTINDLLIERGGLRSLFYPAEVGPPRTAHH